MLHFPFSSGLPPPSISIRDAIDDCPFKAEYFVKPLKLTKASKTERNGGLLESLDDYSADLRPKDYKFITDGIETKKDITRLGMSDNQLKKLNRVS